MALGERGVVDFRGDEGGSLETADSGVPPEPGTVVEMPLVDLVATEHAILLHRSQAEMDDYLVCGDIGGVKTGLDELAVALAPVGLSPWSGIAIFDDEGDGTTTVSMYVFERPGIDTGADDVPTGPFSAPDEAFDDDRDAAGGAVQPHKADKDAKGAKGAKDEKEEKDRDGQVDVCHFPGHDGDFLIGDDAVLEFRCEDLDGNVITVSGKALEAHVAL